MTYPEGGLRDRLIIESLHKNLHAHLTTLGWFDPTVFSDPVGLRQHKPVSMIDEFPDDDENVEFNTIAVSSGDQAGRDFELGSKLEEHEMAIFIDFFAEGDSVGKHLIGDVYEYFRTNDIQTVRDYAGNPLDLGYPEPLFTVEVLDDIDKRKADKATQEWQKHWYVCSFTVVDERSHG